MCHNICVFFNYYNQIPIFLGMFGKNNLIYESEFNQNEFEKSKFQSYLHTKLNTRFIFYASEEEFLNEDLKFYAKYSNIIFFAENLNENNKIDEKINNIKNSKKFFIWHYGEVFTKNIYKIVSSKRYNFIYSGSKREELINTKNYIFDPLFPFRYFRYYIGFVYLENFITKFDIPKYNKNFSKLFSYTRAHLDSSWRTKFIQSINNIEKYLEKKDSANDAYDLLFPKYKHFEAINDYIFCNFNLIFETIDPRNNSEWFLTEKTYKGLFFGKPFLLVAPYEVLNVLREKGFFILNFEFIDKIESYEDVQQSIQNFILWMDLTEDSEIERRYNLYLEKSKKNTNQLINYLNDYSQYEYLISHLLNNN